MYTLVHVKVDGEEEGQYAWESGRRKYLRVSTWSGEKGHLQTHPSATQVCS